VVEELSTLRECRDGCSDPARTNYEDAHGRTLPGVNIRRDDPPRH
jgi:hypothetical protein